LLYVTAANLVRDHWRKEDRQRGAMRRARTEVFLALRDPGTESSVLVRQIVQSMPDRLRTSVLLYYFADLAVRDIAFLTRRKERTIRGDLHAAREHLRAVLGERCEHTD
jgi:RNA polymerase sigma-70 factor (ECF subfamily)